MNRQIFQSHEGISFSLILPKGYKAYKVDWSKDNPKTFNIWTRIEPGFWTWVFMRKPDIEALEVDVSKVSLKKLKELGTLDRGASYKVGVNLVYDYKLTEKRAESIPIKRLNNNNYDTAECEFFQTKSGTTFFFKNRVVEYDNKKGDTRYIAEINYALVVGKKSVSEEELRNINQILNSFKLEERFD